MTTVATAQTDAALGTLAATAEQTGCPPEPVRRMCELADFTRGLDISAITGAVDAVGVSAAVDATMQVVPLVTAAAGTLEGVGGGTPSQGLCDAGDALAAHTGLWRDAVGSVGGCAGAMEQLTAGCAGEISALVEDVCGLASAAVACGAGDAAGGLVEGAVTAVSGILGQRNTGLEQLVDITVGDCLPASGDALLAGAAGVAGLALGVGAAVAVGGAVEMAAEFTGEFTAECAPEPTCPDPAAVSAPEPAPEPSVDPVHGFDKTDRQPGATDTPIVVADTGAAPAVEDATPPVSPAAVGETSGTAAAESSGTPPVGDSATDSWNPDIWTTGDGEPAGSVSGFAPESADAW